MITDLLRTTYGEGNCHLLSLYMKEKLPESQIYVLTSTTRAKAGKMVTLIVHSVVYYEGYYYDIYGKYDSKDHIIRHWVAMYDEDPKTLDIVSCSEHQFELELDQYSDIDHIEARMFVDQNLKLLLDSSLVRCDFDN